MGSAISVQEDKEVTNRLLHGHDECKLRDIPRGYKVKVGCRAEAKRLRSETGFMLHCKLDNNHLNWDA